MTRKTWSTMTEAEKLNALHFGLGTFTAHMTPDDLRARAKRERKAGWFYADELAALLEFLADGREAVAAAKAAS